MKKDSIKNLDLNHIKLSFNDKNELTIQQLGTNCNLCGNVLREDVNYCLVCGTKINKSVL